MSSASEILAEHGIRLRSTAPGNHKSKCPKMLTDPKTQTRSVPVRHDQIGLRRVVLPQLRLAGRAAL